MNNKLFEGPLNKLLLLYILLLITIVSLSSCNNNSKENTLIRTKDMVSSCSIYSLNNNSYSYNIALTFKIQPIIIGTTILDVAKLDKVINSKFEKGNVRFIINTPNYLIKPDTKLSYLDLFETEYVPGIIKVIIVSNTQEFYEDSKNNKLGAADGVPTLNNPSIARPIMFIRENYIYTDIVNHELGHIFGLFHTFENNDLINKGQNCNTGDEILTTITPHPEGGIYMENCEYYLPEYLRNSYADSDKINIVENIESYSPHHCMKDFNIQQFQRMRKIVEINSRLQDCIVSVINITKKD